GVFAAVVTGNIILAYRTRPALGPARANDPVARYRDGLHPLRKPVLIALTVAVVIFAGSASSGQWSTYLKWRESASVHEPDVYFGQDIFFFVFGYPLSGFLGL